MNPTGQTNTSALWVKLTALERLTYGCIQLCYQSTMEEATSGGKGRLKRYEEKEPAKEEEKQKEHNNKETVKD